MLTIDLFTTPKPFTGLTAINQANALRSWRGCPQVRQIFVFGAVSGETDSIAEAGAEVILDVECTDNGLPSIRSMFEIAAERSEADLLMFTNADMIYLPSFFASVNACRAEAGERFLLVGSRMDFDSESSLSFGSPDEIARFEAHLNSVGKMHPPSGSDYFIFPRKQYLENRLPDLWIGRGGWDLYMIYHAKTNGFLTVDLSPSVWGYHQNHDYSSRGKEAGVPYRKDPEAAYNMSLLPVGVPKSEWVLSGCAREWIDSEMNEKPMVKSVAKKGVGKTRRVSGPSTITRLLRRLKNRILGRGKRLKEEKSAGGAGMQSKPNIREDLRTAAGQGRDLNLVVGAAKTNYPGWISSNIGDLNLLERSNWEACLGDLRLDKILAEHVWEHLTPEDGVTALKNCAAYLREGGIIRIAVPDGHHPDADYIEHVKPGGIGPGADDHKILYTAEILEAAMCEAGLVPEVLEHWDSEGAFHVKEWDPADGKVVRSLRFDSRNINGEPRYTSLIVDGRKPVR